MSRSRLNKTIKPGIMFFVDPVQKKRKRERHIYQQLASAKHKAGYQKGPRQTDRQTDRQEGQQRRKTFPGGTNHPLECLLLTRKRQ